MKSPILFALLLVLFVASVRKSSAASFGQTVDEMVNDDEPLQRDESATRDFNLNADDSLDEEDADEAPKRARRQGEDSFGAETAPTTNADDEVASTSGDDEEQLQGNDSNIENAKLSPNELETAAGHHHHHKHYPHGKLVMGAETGKKGAFKWHDKHPVGGKGRR